MDTANTFQSVVEKYISLENDIKTNQYFKYRIDRHYPNNNPTRDYKLGELEQPYQGLLENRRFDGLIAEATMAMENAANEILHFLTFYPILNFKHTQTVHLEQERKNVTNDFVFSKDASTNRLKVEKTEHV